jgi:phosphoglycolate phosphatase
MPPVLLLFDIDGTLLTSGGAGEKALRTGLLSRFGIQDDLQGIEIAGRTDSGIARRILERHQIPPAPENVRRLLDGYLEALPTLLPLHSGRVLHGVLPLLNALRQRSDCILGLLTGNLEQGARLKLAHYGLHDRFQLGAYADDHHDRNALVPFALRRASALAGTDIPPARTWVIGDTPYDVECARAGGARAAAVATGVFSSSALAAAQPDLLLPDLGQTDRILELLLPPS